MPSGIFLFVVENVRRRMDDLNIHGHFSLKASVSLTAISERPHWIEDN